MQVVLKTNNNGNLSLRCSTIDFQLKNPSFYLFLEFETANMKDFLVALLELLIERTGSVYSCGFPVNLFVF